MSLSCFTAFIRRCKRENKALLSQLSSSIFLYKRKYLLGNKRNTYHIDIIITIFLLGEDKGHVKCSIRYKMKLDHIVHLQKH